MAMKWIVAMVLLPALALAQPDEPALRAKVRDRVHQEVVERLADKLSLDPQTAQRYRAIVDSFDAQIAELVRDNGAAHHEIKKLVDSGRVDAASVGSIADRMLANKEKITHLEADRSRQVRQVLSPMQYAQLLLFAPKVQKEVRLELWKAMAGRGEPPQEP
jgi:hypothetical protein